MKRLEAYPEILKDFRDKAKALLQAKMTPEAAEDLSFSLAEILRKNWGGTMVYVPKGRLAKRN